LKRVTLSEAKLAIFNNKEDLHRVKPIKVTKARKRAAFFSFFLFAKSLAIYLGR
jgi:hypothetical protein